MLHLDPHILIINQKLIKIHPHQLRQKPNLTKDDYQRMKILKK